MKTKPLILALLVASAGTLPAQNAPAPASSGTPGQGATLPAPTPYHIVERGANHRVWQRETYERSPGGQVVPHIHKVTELASGLYFKPTPRSDWTESQELIEAVPGGAVAQGPYQVIFADNLNSAGAIDMQTPDGKRLRSNILGLAYYDSSSGQSITIAQIQDSQGQLISSNQILFTNAFTGVQADVRYSYKKSSFEQDVILREQLPSPESFGLSSEFTEVEVLTEFINPPPATIKNHDGATGADVDQDVSWGVTRLGHGNAFDLGGDTTPRHHVRVKKQYATINGRNILLEIVPLKNIQIDLQNLPQHASIKSKLPQTASKEPLLPRAPLAQAKGEPMKLASVAPSKTGYVLDYVEINADQTNMIFQADTTYYISADVNLTGITTFEGGTVIKYTEAIKAQLDMDDQIICPTGNYSPAVFTSVNDDTVGESIGSTYPSSGEAYYLVQTGQASPLKNMRFCYAGQAISQDFCDISDAQFIQCGSGNSGIVVDCMGDGWDSTNSHPDADILLRNVLFSQCSGYVAADDGLASRVTICGEHLTIDQSLVTALCSLNLTNCILSNISQVNPSGTTLGCNNGFYNCPMFGDAAYTNESFPFQVAGAGSYYLPTNSIFCNVGTTNIDPVLLADLATKTTWPPVIYSNTPIAGGTFSPCVQRDTNSSPTLGYHYSPLDYCFGGVDSSTNVVFTAGTTVGWFELPGSGGPGYGISLPDASSVSYNGTLAAPCAQVRYSRVQEGGNGNWPDKGWLGAIAAMGDSQDPAAASILNARFTLFAGFTSEGGAGRDYSSGIIYSFTDCELDCPGAGGYADKLYLTNCFMWRAAVGAQADSSVLSAVTLHNCTMKGGLVYGGHWSDATWPVYIQNSAFEGTDFSQMDDPSSDPTIMYADYNAFLSGAGQPPESGTHNQIVTNFNWQTSWLGNYYLPTNSLLIGAGSTNANLLGLYYFTTQTNQTEEGTATVDIGYHYAAIDPGTGQPYATFTNGVPDYILDTHGTGLPDAWLWYWFGNYNQTSTNLDVFFRTLLFDYQTGINPNKFSSSMTVGLGDDTVGQCDVPYGLTNALQVAGGGGHSLVLKNDGTVMAWGWNYYGQTTVPTGLSNVVMIAAGYYHSVALLTNGLVVAWGLNTYPWVLTQVPANLTNVTVVSALSTHTMALRSNGTVVVWGYDQGSGVTAVPSALTNVTAISAGGNHCLAVSNGFVVAWGSDLYHQCDVPAGLSNVVDVAGGAYHSLALKTDGTVTAWGRADGETAVPGGLSNVVAIAAGGDTSIGTGYSMALTKDGIAFVWGDDEAADPVGGLNNVIAIAAGADHALAVRTGPPTPVITLEPTNEYQVQGGNVTFTARGTGLYGVTYQWQTNGVNLTGATSATLTLANVQAAQLGVYHAVVTDNAGMGDIVSSNASFNFVTPPVITYMTLPTNQVAIYLSNLVLNVVAAAPGMDNGFPLSYQWQFNGVNIPGATSASYTVHATATSFGTYSVLVSNAAGSTNTAWQVTVDNPSGLLLTRQPSTQYQIAGGNVTFVGGGVSSNSVTYQWLFKGTNIAGATNFSLLLTNVQAAQQGRYNFTISDGVNSLTSSNANFYLVMPPTIVSQTLPTNQIVALNSNLTLNVAATALGLTNGFPLHYQWQFNGANLLGRTSTNYTFEANNSGVYSVVVTNAAGSTNASWLVYVPGAGSLVAWGDNEFGESAPPLSIGNISAIAAGELHSVAVEDNGTVVQWGYNWDDVPSDLTNGVAVAAGYEHSIALRSDGTVEVWGSTNSDADYVPAGLNGVKAVAAGWYDNVVLLTNGTVAAWGLNGDAYGWGDLTNVTGLTNITAISASGLHALALTGNGTVLAWGDDEEGESDVPAGLSNVVAVAAGALHSLAVKADGTVVAWGLNNSNQCNVPAGLSNVMAVAAGYDHSVALLNNGTVISWGDDSEGQTNTPALSQVKLIAAGGDHTVADVFSPTVMYPVDVTKDLLLIYNTNSIGSTIIENYYLQNRPMVGGANVLGIGCDTNEITTGANFTNQILTPYLNWLNQNPTKHPQYLLLFMDIPSRVEDTVTHPSVQYQLSTEAPGIQTFVSSINMNGVNGTNDCIAYINKLVSVGTNYSPGKLIISASAGGYANTNYIVDDVNNGYCGDTFVSNTTNGLAAAGVSNASISFLAGCETTGNLPHLTNAVNVAGYISWGFHSSLGGYYATNGIIRWSGNSGWWIIRTEESFNGQRTVPGGNFLPWFSSNAFGGTNYSNTPIGGPTYTEEPGAGGTDNAALFSLWAEGNNLAICAWNANHTAYVQVVGDPFVTR